jgi:hypothetical protein
MIDAICLTKQAQSVRDSAPKAAIFISRAIKGTKLLDKAMSHNKPGGGASPAPCYASMHSYRKSKKWQF